MLSFPSAHRTFVTNSVAPSQHSAMFYNFYQLIFEFFIIVSANTNIFKIENEFLLKKFVQILVSGTLLFSKYVIKLIFEHVALSLKFVSYHS